MAIALVVTAGAAILFIRLIDVILLIFTGALLAVLLHAIAEPLRTHLRFRRTLALTAALAVVTLAIALLLWAFGSQLETQLSALSQILPEAWRKLEGQLSLSPIGRLLLEAFLVEARARGADRFHLEVRDGNPAVRLYESAGFTLAGRRRNYYSGDAGRTFDALTLTKVASPPR